MPTEKTRFMLLPIAAAESNLKATTSRQRA